MVSNSTFTEFNVRQEEGKQHFVRLHDSVVKRLEGQLGRRQRGLLLGSIETGEGCTIAVEEFEPAALIEERIRTWRAQAGSGRQPVGYYRVHNGSEFELEAEDRALFERCFPDEPRLVLLVKPPKGEVGTAKFFLGVGGRLLADRATVEFPFNLRELGAEDTPAEPEPEPEERAKPFIMPGKAASARRAGTLWKIAIAAALVIASGIGLSALKVFDRQTAPARPAVIVRDTLPIAREVSPSQPAESVKPPISSPEKAAPARPAPAANQAADPTAPPPAAPAAQPVLMAQTPAPIAPVQPAAEVRTPAPPADLPPPIRKEAAPTQAAPPPAVISSPKPVEPNVPVVSITPPRAIQQVTPELPGKALKSIVGEVVVRLKVYVDASGRVTSTEPVPGSASVDPALTSAVSSAVKRSKFEPARRGSEKVPGDLVLSFVFRK